MTKLAMFSLALGLIISTAIANVYPTTPDYERSYFGGWVDEDKDCLDTRHEVLQKNAIHSTIHQCKVVSGLWRDPYTGSLLDDPYLIDIDHVVSLKDMWDRGAFMWNEEQLKDFANDFDNLVITHQSVNRSKGSKGMLEWLPVANKCHYVTHYVFVLEKYNMPVSEREYEIAAAYC